MWEIFKDIKKGFTTCCKDLEQSMEEKAEKSKYELAKAQKHHDKVMAGDVDALEIEKQKFLKDMFPDQYK